MSETLGQRLRQAREERHLSLQQAADSTRIRLHHLQALETDDYSLIPSAAQARGFLRNYADFLGIDLGRAVADVQRARPQPAGEVSGPLPKVDLVPDAPTPPHEAVEEQAASAPPAWSLRAAENLGTALRSARASVLARLRKAVPAADEDSAAPPAGPSTPEPAVAEDAALATETAVEPAVQSAPEKKKQPRPKKAEAETPPSTVEESAPPEPDRARVEETDARVENPPGTSAQAEAPDEAQEIEPAPNVWSRLASFFRVRLNRTDESPEAVSVEPESPAELVPSTPTAAETPETIFAEIGQRLRQRRELLSLTLDEVERHIRVRAMFVRAIEEGAYDRLPSAVQTRGMLANYAAFLDLDTEAILLRFADAIQAGHRLRYPEKPGGNKSPMRVSPSLPPLRSFIAGDLVFGVSIAVLLVTMAIWGVNRVFSAQAERAALPTAPSISDVLATSQQPTALQEVTLIPAADTPIASDGIATLDATIEAPAFDAIITVQVTIAVVERTFLRVLVDGEEALNGRVLPGATYTYEASESVEVLTGNAAALRITYNGRDLGLMGNFGEVVNRIYTADGVTTPTPAAPATATPTLSPTPSPTPSATPRTPSPAPGE